jgi:hypothetical protein
MNVFDRFMSVFDRFMRVFDRFMIENGQERSGTLRNGERSGTVNGQEHLGTIESVGTNSRKRSRYGHAHASKMKETLYHPF